MVPSELGAFLQASREAQGLTLDELAASTHIRRKYLESLEAGDWDALPPGVYTRGLLRSYAKAVGASEKSALRYYLKERPSEAKLPEPQLISQPLVEEPRYSNEMLLAAGAFALAAVLLVWLVKTEFSPLLDAARELLAQGADGTNGSVTAVVSDDTGTSAAGTADPTATTVVSGLGTPVGGFSGGRPTVGLTPGTPASFATTSGTVGSAGAAAETPGGIPAAAPGGTPVGTPGGTPTTAIPGTVVDTPPPDGVATVPVVAAVAGGGLRMAVNATGRVWLRVITDGEVVFEDFIAVGEGRAWSARESVEVRTGNAGGTQVTMNGQVLEPLGAHGVVLTCSWRLLQNGAIEQTC